MPPVKCSLNAYTYTFRHLFQWNKTFFKHDCLILIKFFKVIYPLIGCSGKRAKVAVAQFAFISLMSLMHTVLHKSHIVTGWAWCYFTFSRLALKLIWRNSDSNSCCSDELNILNSSFICCDTFILAVLNTIKVPFFIYLSYFRIQPKLLIFCWQCNSWLNQPKYACILASTRHQSTLLPL